MVAEHFNRFETKAKIAFVKMSLCCCSLANKIVLEIYVILDMLYIALAQMGSTYFVILCTSSW